MADAQPAGPLAGVDYGTVRIGIAITDPGQTIAFPLENYTRRSRRADAEFFRRLIDQERITRWVVGLPVHTSGRESEKSKEARQFAQWLGESTGVEVDLFDERYTTAAADELLAAANLTRKKKQTRRDKLAAQIMLTAFLESGQRGTPDPEPLS